ncbi:hypothetical protein C8D97_10746 [Pleionea mediterranea]|uniref:Uncharacterized protein n=1 Tax=Pleionea mediterranea TaxID=523701 RepID=A0A316FNU3_9GAMM|nr:hypothetical protein C8D97_10746 [Pleionea mediterranea]
MPFYIVNRNPQSTGEHEVHRNDCTCSHMPTPSNRIDLGFHYNCQGAIIEAKRRFPGHQFDGCYYCSNACHAR